MSRTRAKPTLAVWKFASCDGCQLSLLDLEDDLLALAGAVEIARLPRGDAAAASQGPYDLSLVEGSITTAHDAERIQEVRRMSKTLVTIGACATAGGVQALRNFADVDDFIAAVYASPEYISTLATSTPIAAHVQVDFELHGCPINKRQLLEVVTRVPARRASPASPRRASAPSASAAARCASRSRTGRRASGRSRMPAAAPSARPTTAAASAASARWRRPNTGALMPLLRSQGLDRAARGARVPDLQRRGRAVPEGGWRDELRAQRTIRTDYLARVEGEGALTVQIEDGRVEHAELRIFEPPRFFEALLRGRSFREAPDITARICGICPVAYQTSAINAMENLCGVEVPEPIRMLRRLLYCGEWIESHALHVYMLHAPDFLGYTGAVELARDAPEARRAGPRAEEDRATS